MAALPPRTQPRGAAPPALPPRRRPPPAPCDSENGQSDDEDYLKPNQKDDDDPGEIYDDCSETDEAAPTTDEIYDDCDDDGPDSSHANEEPEGFYDDCNEQPSQPFAPRGLPPPPQTFEDEPQDTYDDLDVGEPVVQQVPKRPGRSQQLPPHPLGAAAESQTDSESDDFPPPPSPIVHKKSMIGLYAPPPPPSPPLPFMSSAVTPSSNHFGNRINELDNGGEPSSCPAPPPPPPPVSANKGVVVTRVSPKSKPITPNPAPPKPAPGPGGFSLDVNQLKGLRAGLRPVGQDKQAEAKTKSNDNPQESSTVSVSDFRKRFQGEKPETVAKPAVLSKPGGWKPPSGGNHVNTMKYNSSSPFDSSRLKQPEKESSDGPKITFLPNANKHTNVSGLPQSSAAKPVTKYEPPQRQETMECDEIYDDASSGDVLDKFDWYHGYLGRKQADARVSSAAKDGAFLVRVSEKDPRYPYTLVVLHNGHVNNLRVRKREDGKMALGDEKVDELAFVDVTALISHHKNHPVLLLGNNHSQVKLQHTPPKG